jgi:hypothetical protein
MRKQLDSHIEISKLGIKWYAFLRTPTDWKLLGGSLNLGSIVEDCMLNSTFDRSRDGETESLQ